MNSIAQATKQYQQDKQLLALFSEDIRITSSGKSQLNAVFQGTHTSVTWSGNRKQLVRRVFVGDFLHEETIYR